MAVAGVSVLAEALPCGRPFLACLRNIPRELFALNLLGDENSRTKWCCEGNLLHFL